MMGARTNEWHQSLMQVVQDFISMMKCSQIFIVTKQIAYNSMILHIEWSMIFSVLINIYIYNQWQNIMAILKPVFKILPSPPLQCCQSITQVDVIFASHCFSTLLKRAREQKQKIVQTAIIPIIFVTDCLKN